MVALLQTRWLVSTSLVISQQEWVRDQQYGFRCKRSTRDAVTKTWTKAITGSLFIGI